MGHLENEEQHVLNNKIMDINVSIHNLQNKPTLSYETASKKQELISKYSKAKKQPYFGRIDINEDGQSEILYIGETGIEKGNSDIIVVDWRADIAQLYYGFHGGDNQLIYESNGIKYSTSVERKRQIVIENQIVDSVVETLGIPPRKTNEKEQSSYGNQKNNQNEVEKESGSPIYQDDFFKKVLSKNNNKHQLKNIITSIQRGQDEIIRQGIEKNIIVQGASGSGKSSIALHRISYLLYKYRDVLKPNNILILASNKMFISFIQTSFPNLDISGIRQNTFTEWAKELISDNSLYIKEPYETLAKLIDTNYQGLADLEKVAAFKGSIMFKEIIDSYLEKVSSDLLSKEERITINRDDSISTKKMRDYYLDKEHLPLNQRIELLRKFIESEFSESQDKSIQNINRQYDFIFDNWLTELPTGSQERRLLFEQLENIKAQKLKRVRTEHLTVKKQLLQTIKPFSAITVYNNLFQAKHIQSKNSILEPTFIDAFLKTAVNQNEVSAEDVASLLYIDSKLNGVKEKISYLIVDEAQDYSPFEVEVLKMYSKSMTLLGDITQSIYAYKSIKKWGDLTPSVFNFDEVRQMNMNVSYRSTYEIMSLANTIVENSHLPLPLVNPIKRNGDKPLIKRIENGKQLFENVQISIAKFRSKGYSIIGIIGKDRTQTELLYEFLLKFGEKSVQLITDSKQKLTEQIVVIPSYLVKGLEFDAVIIPNAGKDRFSENSIDTKLLYVCITRAHHDLHIYYHGDPSPLLEKKELLIES